jgi:hypothetical protein
MIPSPYLLVRSTTRRFLLDSGKKLHKQCPGVVKPERQLEVLGGYDYERDLNACIRLNYSAGARLLPLMCSHLFIQEINSRKVDPSVVVHVSREEHEMADAPYSWARNVSPNTDKAIYHV